MHGTKRGDLHAGKFRVQEGRGLALSLAVSLCVCTMSKQVLACQSSVLVIFGIEVNHNLKGFCISAFSLVDRLVLDIFNRVCSSFRQFQKLAFLVVFNLLLDCLGNSCTKSVLRRSFRNTVQKHPIDRILDPETFGDSPRRKCTVLHIGFIDLWIALQASSWHKFLPNRCTRTHGYRNL